MQYMDLPRPQFITENGIPQKTMLKLSVHYYISTGHCVYKSKGTSCRKITITTLDLGCSNFEEGEEESPVHLSNIHN